eukprot:85385_1
MATIIPLKPARSLPPIRSRHMHNTDETRTRVTKMAFSSFTSVMKPTTTNGVLLVKTQSCPLIKYDDCREFEAFAGKWVDSKGQNIVISEWGVIRYPANPKLRFEAVYAGPHHMYVFFDKDPKKRKFMAKLNHECTMLVWSNGSNWFRKGCKVDIVNNKSKSTKKTCVIQ